MRRRAFFVLPSEAMGQTSSAKSAERSSRLAAGRPPDAEPPDAGRVVERAWDRAPRGDQSLRAGVDPDLPGQDRQDAVPGSAPGPRRDAAAPLSARYLRAATLRREPPEEAVFFFFVSFTGVLPRPSATPPLSSPIWPSIRALPSSGPRPPGAP